MAKLTINIPDSLQKQLSALGNIDDIAPKMINEAEPIIVDSIKKKLASHRVSGNLIDSVKASKAKKAKNGGYYGKVIFKGYDKESKPSKEYPKGTPNAVKAMAIEYGTENEPAQPFMDSTINDSKNKVLDKMQEVFNREVEK